MMYSINQLVKRKLPNLKSSMTIMSFIDNGKLKATNLKKPGNKNRYLISDEAIDNFYKNKYLISDEAIDNFYKNK